MRTFTVSTLVAVMALSLIFVSSSSAAAITLASPSISRPAASGLSMFGGIVGDGGIPIGTGVLAPFGAIIAGSATTVVCDAYNMASLS